MIGARHPARIFWEIVRRARPGRAADDVAPASREPAIHDAGTKAALAQLDAIRDDCRRLVTRRASLSAGVAVIPLPGLDIGGDIAILLQLLPKINERFGLTPAQIESLDVETKRVVLMFIGSVGSSLVGRLVTRELVMKLLLKMGVRVTTKGVVKFVPLLGQAISASISFGAMKLLGDRHIDDCYEVARRTMLESVEGRSADGQWQVIG